MRNENDDKRVAKVPTFRNCGNCAGCVFIISTIFNNLCCTIQQLVLYMCVLCFRADVCMKVIINVPPLPFSSAM